MAWVTIQAKVLEKMNISILRACFATRKDQSAFLYLMMILYSAGSASHVLTLMLSYHLKMPCSMTFSPISSPSTTGSSRSSGLELGTAQEQGFFNRSEDSNFLLIEFTLKLLNMNVGIQAFESLNHC